MRCKNCDSEIPAGKLECPFCGAEVILVPEYMSADMEREQKRLKILEEEKYLREREMRREQRMQGKKMTTSGKIARTICVVLIALILSYFFRSSIARNYLETFGHPEAHAGFRMDQGRDDPENPDEKYPGTAKRNGNSVIIVKGLPFMISNAQKYEGVNWSLLLNGTCTDRV